MANFLDKDGVVYLWGKIKGKFVAKESGKGLSTNDYTTTEKNKLAGIANGANNYSLPTASASTLGGVKVGTNLSISSGVLSAKDTTYGVMKGATASADGGSGLVPAPTKGNEGKYLKGDGTWGTPANTTYGVVSKTANGLVPKLPDETTTTKYLRQDGAWVVPPNTTYGVMKGATASADGASGLVPAPTKTDGIQYLTNKGTWATIIFPTYPIATSSLDGLMSRTDKAKLNGIANGANKTIVDDTLSDTSTNPVQNKIVKGEIDRAKNIADQSMTLAGNLANALMYEMAINDSGFIFKGTGGTSYSLYKDLTSFVDLSPYAKKADIVGTYKYKGSVDTASALPTSGQTTGDVYNIVASSSYGPAGCNVAWNGSDWDSLGGIFTITSISNSELDAICV